MILPVLFVSVWPLILNNSLVTVAGFTAKSVWINILLTSTAAPSADSQHRLSQMQEVCIF